MRISTAALHAQGLEGLLNRQSALARTQQEMISGQKLATAASDPTAFANAQRLDHVVAALARFESNSGVVEHRLRLQETSLADAGSLLMRARELAVQANGGVLSDENRASIAGELRALRSGLLDIANRDDGAGRRLFSGTRDGVTPFVDGPGGVTYAGDDGRNQVDIGPDVAVADADPGSDLFMRMRTGDGYVSGTAGAANGGSGVLQMASVTDHAAWAGRSLTVQFTAGDSYDLVDAGGAVVGSGSYAPGNTISAGGLQLRLTGAPVAGDTFSVARAPSRDIFATLDALATALETPAASAAERARRDNAVGASISDLGTAQDHLLSARAGTGTRLSMIDANADARSAHGISLAETLSSLRDVNYAEATTQLGLHLTALEAAQRTMVRVQGLSLFDVLR